MSECEVMLNRVCKTIEESGTGPLSPALAPGLGGECEGDRPAAAAPSCGRLAPAQVSEETTPELEGER